MNKNIEDSNKIDLVKNFFENKTESEITDMFVYLNKIRLNQKQHIRKYNKLRKIHSDIIENMQDYITSKYYDLSNSFNSICKDINRETNNLCFHLDSGDIDDITILNDLFMYKNHPKLTSISEIYLQKNKFKNPEKVKMLNSMINSYVGLFKVIQVDSENGYVTYEDVFTKKRFKVIDISMSSTLRVDQNNTLYFYNRVLTVDDISFGTGIHCMTSSKNRLLKEFIKKHRYKEISDFSRCILLYDLSKKNNELTVKYNNQYGSRRFNR